jgi:hypothetical protein
MAVGCLLGCLTAGAGRLVFAADPCADVFWNRCHLFVVSLIALAACLCVLPLGLRVVSAAAAAGGLLWVAFTGALPSAVATGVGAAALPLAVVVLLNRRPKLQADAAPASGPLREWAFYLCFIAWTAVVLTAVWFVPHAMAHAAAGRFADDPRFEILKGGKFALGEDDDTATRDDLRRLGRQADQLRVALWGDDKQAGLRKELDRHGLLPFSDLVQDELARRGWPRHPPRTGKTIRLFVDSKYDADARRDRQGLLDWVADREKDDAPAWPLLAEWREAFKDLVQGLAVQSYPLTPEIEKLDAAVTELVRLTRDNADAVRTNSVEAQQAWAPVHRWLRPAVGSMKPYHSKVLADHVLPRLAVAIDAHARLMKDAGQPKEVYQEFYEARLRPVGQEAAGPDPLPKDVPADAAKPVRGALQDVAEAVRRNRPDDPPPPVTTPAEITELKEAVANLQALAVHSKDQAGACDKACLDAWERVEKAIRPALRAATDRDAGGVRRALDALREAVDLYAGLTRAKEKYKELDAQRLAPVEKAVSGDDLVPAGLSKDNREMLQGACDAVAKAIRENHALEKDFTPWNVDALLAETAREIQLEENWRGEKVEYEGQRIDDVAQAVWDRWNVLFRGSRAINPKVITWDAAKRRALAGATAVLQLACLQEERLWRERKKLAENAPIGLAHDPIVLEAVRAPFGEDPYWKGHLGELKTALTKTLKYPRVDHVEVKYGDAKAVNAAVADNLDMIDTYCKTLKAVGGDDGANGDTLRAAGDWYGVFNANDKPGKRNPVAALLNATDGGKALDAGKDGPPGSLRRLDRAYINRLSTYGLPDPDYEPELFKRWQNLKAADPTQFGT